MIFYYAQLNGEKICFSVSQLAGEVVRDDMIWLESYDVSLLGKRYVNGEWEEVAMEEEIEEETKIGEPEKEESMEMN